MILCSIEVPQDGCCFERRAIQRVRLMGRPAAYDLTRWAWSRSETFAPTLGVVSWSGPGLPGRRVKRSSLGLELIRGYG
jgi:hypothetical protein